MVMLATPATVPFTDAAHATVYAHLRYAERLAAQAEFAGNMDGARRYHVEARDLADALLQLTHAIFAQQVRTQHTVWLRRHAGQETP
jgi:hypothetical protein